MGKHVASDPLFWYLQSFLLTITWSVLLDLRFLTTFWYLQTGFLTHSLIANISMEINPDFDFITKKGGQKPHF
jgi:hypothetical protein